MPSGAHHGPALLPVVGSGGAASAFSPLSIPSLVAWWSFDDITTLFTDTGRTTAVTADAQTIKGVTDKSGQGHHLSNATGATYKANIRAGKSVARFDGSTNTLGASFVQAQPYTIFGIGALSAAAAANRNIVASGTSVSVLRQGGTQKWEFFAGASLLTPASTDTSWHVLSGRGNGASSNLWVDGGASVAGNVGASAFTNPNVGSFDGASQFWLGDIGEVLICSANLSTTQVDQIGNYASRWGTTWTAAS